MRTVKPEIRVLGVDDAPFAFEDATTELVGTVMRAGDYVEGFVVREIAVDGSDVTAAVVDMVNGSRHTDQLQVVLLDGITFGGFNVVDLDRVHEDTGVAVIAVSRNEPDLDRMRRGLENVDRVEERMERIKAAGEAERHVVEAGPVFFQWRGCGEEQAREVLDRVVVRGRVPEPVRLSHLVGAALKNGESQGGA